MCKSKTEFLQTVSYPIMNRTVTVKGPRGSLEKSFKHLAVDIYMVDKDTIKVLIFLFLCLTVWRCWSIILPDLDVKLRLRSGLGRKSSWQQWGLSAVTSPTCSRESLRWSDTFKLIDCLLSFVLLLNYWNISFRATCTKCALCTRISPSTVPSLREAPSSRFATSLARSSSER